MSIISHQPPMRPETHITPSVADLEKYCSDALVVVLACSFDTEPLKVEYENPETKPYYCDAASTVSNTRGKSKDATPPRPLQLYRGKPLILHTLEHIQRSHFREAVIVAPPSLHKELRRTASAATQEKKTGSQIVAKAKSCFRISFASYDAKAAAVSVERGDFQLFELSPYLLQICGSLLKMHAWAKRVVLVGADQVRVMPFHFIKVCKTSHDSPDADIVTSWAFWNNRPPYVISRDKLVSLCASAKKAQVSRKSNADKRAYAKIPYFEVKEVLFNEDKIATNPPRPAEAREFFSKVNLSALEAIQRAQDYLDTLDKDDVPHTNPVENLEQQDALLVHMAIRLLQELDSGIPRNVKNTAYTFDSFAQRCRLDFPLLQTPGNKGSLAYLDSAATAQKLSCAIEAQLAFDSSRNGSIYRGLYELSAQATKEYVAARETIAAFIGAHVDEVVFCANASSALAQTASVWGEHAIGEGDTIGVLLSEHHSNMLPWMLLAKRKNAKLCLIKLKSDGTIDRKSLDDCLALHPKAICLAHVSNILGKVNPIADIARLSHESGAAVILDATQSLAHIPVSVKDLGVDFLAFSGHKLYGPYGVGCLWVSPDISSQLDPLTAGGGTVSFVSQHDYYLRTKPIQFELGTPAVSSVVGLAAALDYLRTIGMEEIQNLDRALTAYAIAGLQTIGNISIWGDHKGASDKTGLVSFSVRGITSALLAESLAALNVAIRHGGHCCMPFVTGMGLEGVARMSTGIHSTVQDIQALLLGIEMTKYQYRHFVLEMGL